MADSLKYIVTLDLSDDDRYAILVNALQDYANDALNSAQDSVNTTAERDHFQQIAFTAQNLLDEIQST
ncbi:hypothetical protein [Pseudoclavibacter terrae]|uniref:Uncharacterized protein n=1 Tax=Pseudoclavibacter terrae TaxID=1530195 RepID=A0A7J5AZN4_9MICO|nr:hypothetical protein [Pseudoclavibacter terrae]KAB1636070.1 hypothetical protein F8O03_17580 [Pseudoclavibacter terrae]